MKTNYKTYCSLAALIVLSCVYTLHVPIILHCGLWSDSFTPVLILIILLIYYSFIYVYKILGKIPITKKREISLLTLKIFVSFLIIGIYIISKIRSNSEFSWDKIFGIFITIALEFFLPELILALFAEDESNKNQDINEENNKKPDLFPSQ